MLFETPTVGGMAAGNAVAPHRIERTPVSYSFFHPRNVEALQTSIRYRVHRQTGKVIDPQGRNQLLTVMQAIYDDSQDPTLESGISGNPSQVIRKLNERVIYRAVSEIVGAMRYHQFYLDDIANPVPQPLPRSQFSDQRTGLKTVELPIGFGAPTPHQWT
nr:hypothetical protein TetV2_00464 [Oceanusvirus sp.]